MLVSAGYLNFTTNQNENTIATSAEEGIDYAGIGDAKLVSSNGVVEQNEQEALVPNNEIQENVIVEQAQNEITFATSSNTSKETRRIFFFFTFK